MSFATYPSYSDSKIPWVGKIPNHWKVLPLYALAVERDHSNKGMIEDNLLSLSYGRIIRKDMSSNDGLLPESFETYQIVSPGDIVFRLTDLQNDKRSLRSALVEERGIITSAYVAIAPRGADSRYLSFLFRAYDVTKVFYSMGGGLRQAMKYDDLKRLPVVLPSLPEQVSIAYFLDQETCKIDALITEQQRLIELLKEKRQAVISHAVTKGLNPDVRMKPSGVEWLGEVPEHWEVLALKRLVSLRSGETITSEVIDEVGEFPVFGGNGLRGFTSSYTHEGSFALVGRQGALCGNVNFAEGKFYASEHAIVATPIRPLDTLWLGEKLRSMNLNQYSISAAQPGLSVQVIQNLWTIYPPIDEQGKIGDFIRVEVARAEALIVEASKAIALLQERRTALISAAVTGKIDVRDYSSAQKDAA